MTRKIAVLTCGDDERQLTQCLGWLTAHQLPTEAVEHIRIGFPLTPLKDVVARFGEFDLVVCPDRRTLGVNSTGLEQLLDAAEVAGTRVVLPLDRDAPVPLDTADRRRYSIYRTVLAGHRTAAAELKEAAEHRAATAQRLAAERAAADAVQLKIPVGAGSS